MPLCYFHNFKHFMFVLVTYFSKTFNFSKLIIDRCALNFNGWRVLLYFCEVVVYCHVEKLCWCRAFLTLGVDVHDLDVRHFSPNYCVLLLAKLILSNWFKTLFLPKEYIRRYSFKNTIHRSLSYKLTVLTESRYRFRLYWWRGQGKSCFFFPEFITDDSWDRGSE